MGIIRPDQAVKFAFEGVSARRISVVTHQKVGKRRFPVMLLKLMLVDGTKRYIPFGWPVKDGVLTATEALLEA